MARGRKPAWGDSADSGSDGEGEKDQRGGKGKAAAECEHGERCFKCRGFGHLSRDCPAKKEARQAKQKCWLCGSHESEHMQGHTRRECPGVDGEAWCSRNKGKSAPPKGGKAVDQEHLESKAAVNVDQGETTAWLDGFTQAGCPSDPLYPGGRCGGSRVSWKLPDGQPPNPTVKLHKVFSAAKHRGSLDSFVASRKSEAIRFSRGFCGCVTALTEPADLVEDSAAAALLEDPMVVSAFAGVGPLHADAWDVELEHLLRARLAHPKAPAVGGCGIDTASAEAPPLEAQLICLRAQARLAGELKRPLGVVMRGGEEAEKALAMALGDSCDLGPNGQSVILLNFDASEDLPARLVAVGLSRVFVGVSPKLGFSKLARRLGNVVYDTPLDRLWPSSDSPDCIPASLGGGRRTFSHPGAVFEGLEELVVLDALRCTVFSLFPAAAAGQKAVRDQCELLDAAGACPDGV